MAEQQIAAGSCGVSQAPDTPRVAHSECHDCDENQCWICLGGIEAGDLVQPCSCPRLVHRQCMARWQLTSAGKAEETRCRFCDRVLPDWRPALTPLELQPKPSVMSVRYRGVTHRIQYTPGPDGLESFLHTLQAIGIKVASASQVTFLCRSPDTGEEMSLRGLKAFDAAAYCASITAAKRLARAAGDGAPPRRRSSSGASDDMGVHAAHPDSPTAAGGARTCRRPRRAGAPLWVLGARGGVSDVGRAAPVDALGAARPAAAAIHSSRLARPPCARAYHAQPSLEGARLRAATCARAGGRAPGRAPRAAPAGRPPAALRPYMPSSIATPLRARLRPFRALGSCEAPGSVVCAPAPPRPSLPLHAPSSPLLGGAHPAAAPARRARRLTMPSAHPSALKTL
ncbi:MAG: hypothetical protein J3K34DRAFT_164013 [Monoraphidium minutum]|nr:MAG: hypothetical protein J3K34DRAFT_164013 [Monoraphidium minutum]